jgi:hypothetical protein
MLRRIKKVEYLSGYQLRLQFDNGRIKVVDLEGMLKNAKNMFLQLVDVNYFKKVECDGYSICWPNGIDFCPDLLYKAGKDIVQKSKRRNSPRSIKTRRKPRLKIS